MKDLDFLPESYRHQRALRHARLCWIGVGLLFGLAIAGAASGQWIVRRKLEGEVRKIEPQYAAAEQRQAEINQLLASKKHAEELAALYAYLEFPWPKTQLLAAVSKSLPESIHLTSLRISQQAEAVPTMRGGDEDSQPAPSQETRSAEISPHAVLAELRAELDHQRTILELRGEAGDSKELHEYVEALAKTPLFASASLKGLESGGENSGKKVSKFEIRVIVHPGYGQPGAPVQKAGAHDVVISTIPARSRIGNPGGLP